MFNYKNWKQNNETEANKDPDEEGVQRAPTNLKELDTSKPLPSLSRAQSSGGICQNSATR